MGPGNDDDHLHIPGYGRGNGSAHHAQLREAELTEDQQIIQRQVHQHGHHARYHGHLRLAALPQGAGVYLLQHKGRQPYQHHPEVFPPIPQRGLQGLFIALPVQIHLYQLVAPGHQDNRAQHQNPQAHINLEPQGMLDALVVLAAEKLGAKNPHPGDCPEDGQVEYHQKLVHDGDAGHLLRADPPHHDIVQQTYEIRDAVLNHDGHRHSQHFRVECFVSE